MNTTKIIQTLLILGIVGALFLAYWGFSLLYDDHTPFFFRDPAALTADELRLANLRLTNAIRREENVGLKIGIQREHLHRDATVAFVFYLGIPVIGVILITGISVSFIVVQQKHANLTTVTLPGGSVIPVQRQHLHEMTPIIHNLTLAQITAANGGNVEQSWAMAQQIIASSVAVNRSLGMDKRASRIALPPNFAPSEALAFVPDAYTASSATTFAELHTANRIHTDHGLLVGFNTYGNPEYRAMSDFKSVAVGGEQRSGKSYAVAYLMTCFWRYYHAEIHLLDMHWQHQNSLTALVHPLIDAKQFISHNPIDALEVIAFCNEQIDARLQNQASQQTPLILVIDETLSLIKNLREQGQLHQLVNLMKRCGEETAKVNVMLIAISHRWTQKDIGDAEIRRAMNSVILLHQHPDTADLFLRDRAQSKMIRQLRNPGEALVMISYDSEPTHIRFPFISRGNIEDLAATCLPPQEHPMLDTNSTITTMQWDELVAKINQSNMKQAALAQQSGVSPSTFSRILRGEQRTNENFDRLNRLFPSA